jgi:mono/diheme cytochrome c family protein
MPRHAVLFRIEQTIRRPKEEPVNGHASLFLAVALLMLVPSNATAAGRKASRSDDLLERGRYLVQIAGCNDCHTAGYLESDGQVPEDDWLQGDTLGWRGPWGTTYPPNLRLFMRDVSEDRWLAFVREAVMRPPMPWFNLRAMTDQDLRAVYQFIRHLGPAGGPAPVYVPPDREPPPPFVQFPMPAR